MRSGFGLVLEPCFVIFAGLLESTSLIVTVLGSSRFWFGFPGSGACRASNADAITAIVAGLYGASVGGTLAWCVAICCGLDRLVGIGIGSFGCVGCVGFVGSVCLAGGLVCAEIVTVEVGCGSILVGLEACCVGRICSVEVVAGAGIGVVVGGCGGGWVGLDVAWLGCVWFVLLF